MIKTLNNTIKQDRTAYKIPRSVQDVIPIQRIFADGIFQFGTKYSRTLRFSDINYAIASKEDKTAMFLGYSELLNALDSGSTTKLTICNKQVNRQAFEDTVLLPQRGDSLDGFVDEFNGMLEGKISGSSASVEQERFITVSVHKKNVDEARTFFSRVTGEVSSIWVSVDKQNTVCLRTGSHHCSMDLPVISEWLVNQRDCKRLVCPRRSHKVRKVHLDIHTGFLYFIKRAIHR